MANKPKREAKPLLSRSPSPSSSVELDSDVQMKAESKAPKPEPDDSESMPPPDTESATSSESSVASNSRSPTPPPTPARSKKGAVAAQLIGDLPIARDAALDTFNELSQNFYQFKTLGLSRESTEGMKCECTFSDGDDPTDACGHNSNCINRLTQVECMPDDCRCGEYCQNQRFQRKQYAAIEIVQTEKKGFGLRAERAFHKDTFIYEYVGDVVNPASFKKRMRAYADEGIRHFYFMMLQKDEFIDATKNGGMGRFANHSCNPNCYVAKWTVGDHVRMGIFSKRAIAKHEELTFNYNVDRYGHQAQECYCGEPNCVGFIGGKTQTDVVTFDDLYLDALGIDEADILEAKGTKKKKGKKIDDPDFAPAMYALEPKHVPKVIQALRQTQSKKMILKLLARVHLTEDESVMRELMRLRAFSLMKNLLEDHISDNEIVTLVLRCMVPWPILVNSKIEASRIDEPVRPLLESEDENIKTLAEKLLGIWDQLPKMYRIPKRVLEDGHEVADSSSYVYKMPTLSRAGNVSLYPPYIPPTKRLKSLIYIPPQPKPPPPAPRVPIPRAPTPPPTRQEILWDTDSQIRNIIAVATAQKRADDAAAAEAAAKLAASAEEHKKKSRPPKKVQTPEEKEKSREKQLLKLIGAVVVKSMSKYGSSLERDRFKRHAKELTQLLADKEKKSSSYKDSKLDALSDEKVAKIKKFSKEYITKVVRKRQQSSSKGKDKRLEGESSATASSSALDTPNSGDGADAAAPAFMAEMTVEEAMDMDPASESEGEREDGGLEESPHRAMAMDWEPAYGPASTVEQVKEEPMQEVSEYVKAEAFAADPRRRPPNEDAECGWDPHRQADKQNGVISVATL